MALTPESNRHPSFLSYERVYYQAQFHLTLYYSLVEKTSQVEFEALYKTAKQTSYWEHVDNLNSRKYPAMKVGDYILLELCNDCVMLVYLMPHVSKQRTRSSETTVGNDHVALAFELIYFRLLRYLCGLVEAFMDMIGVEARAMMTLKNSMYFMCRSVNRQALASDAGGQLPRLAQAPPELQPRSQKPKPDENAVAISTNHAERTSLLQQRLDAFNDGDKVAISIVSDIKQLQRDRVEQWRKHLIGYRNAGYDGEVGLKSEMKEMIYLLDPERFPTDHVYPHVHKRAALAIVVTANVAEKVCSSNRLYPSQEDVDDGIGTGETDTSIFERWKSIISNQARCFKHFSGELKDS